MIAQYQLILHQRWNRNMNLKFIELRTEPSLKWFSEFCYFWIDFFDLQSFILSKSHLDFFVFILLSFHLLFGFYYLRIFSKIAFFLSQASSLDHLMTLFALPFIDTLKILTCIGMRFYYKYQNRFPYKFFPYYKRFSFLGCLILLH